MMGFVLQTGGIRMNDARLRSTNNNDGTYFMTDASFKNSIRSLIVAFSLTVWKKGRWSRVEALQHKHYCSRQVQSSLIKSRTIHLKRAVGSGCHQIVADDLAYLNGDLTDWFSRHDVLGDTLIHHTERALAKFSNELYLIATNFPLIRNVHWNLYIQHTQSQTLEQIAQFSLAHTR